MTSRPHTAVAAVIAGLFLSALAPVGPLALPTGLPGPFGDDERHHAKASAAPPPPPIAQPVPALAELPAPAARPVTSDDPKLTTPAQRFLPDADRGPRCDQTQRPGKSARYNGRSASQLYDRVFRPGPEMPHLDGWVPQGLAAWQNWDGKGHTLVLIGMYRPGRKSFLVGLNPMTGHHLGTIRVKASHLGAIGVSGKWLITQDNDSPHRPPAVRRYTLSKLRAKMLRSAATSTKPFMAAYGRTQRIPGASFMFVENESLWIGRYARNRASTMYRYTLRADGRLRQADGPWRVPARTQGVMVTEDHFIFTSSLNKQRGRLVVFRRDTPERTKVPVACLWTPSLPQNMTVHRDRILTAYESGARRFKRLGPRNKITHLHVGTVRTLLEVVDPNSLQAFYAPAAPERQNTAYDLFKDLTQAALPAIWGASPDRAAEAIARAEGRATPNTPAALPAPGAEPTYAAATIPSPTWSQPGVPAAGAQTAGAPTAGAPTATGSAVPDTATPPSTAASSPGPPAVYAEASTPPAAPTDGAAPPERISDARRTADAERAGLLDQGIPARVDP